MACTTPIIDGAAWGDVMDDDVKLYTEHMTVLRERDEARAECSGLQVALRAAERENAELRARVETCERERSYDLANECIADNQRDEARAALAALLDGLGRDDNPRREAIDKARALDVWWALRDRAKQRGESAEEWLAYVEFVHAREAGR